VILFAASMIQKDGYFILAGIVMFIATIAFSGAIGVGGVSRRRLSGAARAANPLGGG